MNLVVFNATGGDVKSSFTSCAVKKGFTNPMIGASSQTAAKLHSQVWMFIFIICSISAFCWMVHI